MRALPRGDRAALCTLAARGRHGPAAPRTRSGEGAARWHRGSARAMQGQARAAAGRNASQAGGEAAHADVDAQRAGRGGGLRPPARGPAGSAGAALAPAPLCEALGGRGVRGHGCRGQGRGDPANHRGARCPPVSRGADLGAVAGGTCAALSLALLVPAAAARQLHRLRPLPVRPCARRTGARSRGTSGLAARLRRDQRVRARARRARNSPRQVLAVGEPRRAGGALRGTQPQYAQALQGGSGGPAEPRAVARLPGGCTRHDRAHRHAARSLDRDTRGRQAPRTPRGAAGSVRAHINLHPDHLFSADSRCRLQSRGTAGAAGPVRVCLAAP